MIDTRVEELVARDDVDVVLETEERQDGGRKIVKFQYVQRSTGEVLVSRPPRESEGRNGNPRRASQAY